MQAVLAAAVVVGCAQTASAEGRTQLDELVRSTADSSSGGMSADEYCLTEAVYFEAGGEPVAGRAAVAEVVLNRTRSGLYPRTVCGVVRQKGQFTYRVHRVDPTAWREAHAVAALTLAGRISGWGFGSIAFHSPRVRPYWTSALRFVGRVGGVVLYARR